jgi:3-oxoacyl-[acyl-carrier-protein] synthase II
MRREVVITGLGVVSPYGIGMDALWAGLCSGRSALKPVQAFDATGFPAHLGGEATDAKARDYVPKSYRKAVKVMARDTELAVVAANLAVQDADLITRATPGDNGAAPDATTYPGDRMGCHIGAGLVAAETTELARAFATARAATDPTQVDWAVWGQSGMSNLPPLWLLKYLPNMLACHVTILHGAEGPSNTITCSEASGLLSIGESARVIERGTADICFSGGAESRINDMGYIRMHLAGWLAATGDAIDGGDVVRPYDPTSPGGVLGEGGGILVLEEEASARARGVRVYARIEGFGAGQSSLMDHETAGDQPDEGLLGAIESALADADISPNEIDAIVPWALGSPIQDAREEAVLASVFGSRLAQIPLVTLSPNIGNCLAGAGSLALAAGARCLSEQMLPGRIHSGRTWGRVDAGPCEPRGASLRHVLVCSSAMCGQNAAVVIGAVR